MRARYTPSWGHDPDTKEELIGAIGPLDVYYEFFDGDGDGEHHVYVVGPRSRKLLLDSTHNFDGFQLSEGRLLEATNALSRDMHIELHEMCELYALLVEKGYITLDIWRSSDAGK